MTHAIALVCSTPTTDRGREAARIADEAIALFLEYRDMHGHDEASARASAIAEIAEGMSVDADAISRELAAPGVEAD